MADFDELFESMMREMVNVEGAKLLREEQVWRERVPASVDRAAWAALQGGAAVKTTGGRAAGTVPHVLKAAAAALAGAVLVSAGAYALSPGFRAYVSTVLTGETTVWEERAPSPEKPGDYTIPLPGEEFTVTDEVVSETMAYKWFTSEKQEVLVEIARRLPDSVEEAWDLEYIALPGSGWGSYYENGDQKIVVFRDGEVYIRIVFFNAEKEEILAYAGRLAEINGG